MKRLLFTLIGGLLWVQAASAQNLTGKWVGTSTGPGGATTETAYYFTAQNGGLTGYIVQRQTTSPILEGTVRDGGVSFKVTRRGFGGEVKVSYQGKVTPEGLDIEIVTPGNSRGFGPRLGFGTPPDPAAPQLRKELLKRVSSDVPPPMPVPPPKVTLAVPPEGVPYNNLSKAPPMGWNSWNKFEARVSDKMVREIADAMAANGMRDAGYVYVNIDDTWEAKRDAQGNILANEKFPDMKALAAYVHSKGLKLGIYSSPGPLTCAGYEGSYGHEEQDAKTYASWGIDYLKYDWCTADMVYESSAMAGAYAKMGQALLKSGRPIVYSLCQYGLQDVGEWGARIGGNLWRTTGDIQDNWASMSRIGFDQQPGREKFTNPGHWNDPDMLEIGNGGMNNTEYRTHMSLWSLLAAPLLAGNDVRSMSPDILEILTNREVVAIDQDPLGVQAKRVFKDGDLEVWARPLADGSHAVGMFNRGPSPARVAARWQDIGVTGARKVRDLWAHADRGTGSDSFWAEVPSHGVVLIRLTSAAH